VEAGKAVAWTKPEDIPYDANQPLPEVGAFFKGPFRVLFADCVYRLVPQTYDEVGFRSAILRNGTSSWPDEQK